MRLGEMGLGKMGFNPPPRAPTKYAHATWHCVRMTNAAPSQGKTTDVIRVALHHLVTNFHPRPRKTTKLQDGSQLALISHRLDATTATTWG